MSTQIDERIRRYIAWPPLELPVQHSEGYSLCEFKGICKGCGKPCEELRGEVTEWPNCLQLRCAGRCDACALVTTFEIRWGKDSMVHHSTQGWVLYTFNEGRTMKIVITTLIMGALMCALMFWLMKHGYLPSI